MRLPTPFLMSAVLAAFVAGCTPDTFGPELEPQFAKAESAILARASGSGIRTATTRHFEFSATQKADGTVLGQFNGTREGPNNPRFHGQILCLRVSGNQAWVGYRITGSNLTALVGTEGGFYAEDNGEGAGSADQLSLAYAGGGPGFAQLVCDGGTPIETTAAGIDGGNIQVR